MSDVKVNPAQIAEDAVSVASEVVVNPKGFWKSKTFWAMGLIVAAHYFGYLPPAATPYVVAGAAAGLRLVSDGKVSLTGN